MFSGRGKRRVERGRRESASNLYSSYRFCIFVRHILDRHSRRAANSSAWRQQRQRDIFPGAYALSGAAIDRALVVIDLISGVSDD
jgi:hypothetical protein